MSQAAWARVERRLPAVVDRTIESYIRNSPRYYGAIPEHLDRQMARTCREFGRLCARVAREQRAPRAEELTPFGARAAERGAEGLPAADLVQAWFVIVETLWDELVTAADGTPPAETVAALLTCTHQVVRTAVEAHQDEFQATHSEEREAAGAIARALLAGEPATELAARFGVGLAESYAVLAVRLGEHPTESGGDAVGRHLGGRRKVRRVIAELHRSLGEAVLSGLHPDGGLLLVPSKPHGADEAVASVRAALPRLQRTADAAVAIGFAHAADRAGVPAAAQQAQRLLRLARPGDVATLDELLFEYQLSHDGEAVPGLLSIVDVLRAEPDLLSTLQAYLAHDLNRRRTAEHLHVHPNTVDNRLSRVAAVTGADPRTTRGILLFGAALQIAAGGR